MIIILLVVTVQLLLRKNNFMVIRLKYKILIITLIFVALLSLSNVCAVDVNLSEDDVVLNDTHYKNINLDNSDEYCNSNVKEVFGKNNNSQNSFSDVQKLIDDSEENDTIQLNGTYYGQGNLIIVNKSLVIEGRGDGAILDAQMLSGIFYISSNNVILKNLKIINAKAPYNFTNLNNYELISNGAAIYWVGANGTLINSSFSGNHGYGDGGIVAWEGHNGKIFNTSFKDNPPSFKYEFIIGGSNPSYRFIGGVVNGFYDGDLIGNSFLKNVSVNARRVLTVNMPVLYNGELIIKLTDEEGLPFVNDIFKVHIYNKNYNLYLESIIDENGFARVSLPFNLSVGNYNIKYYLKQILDSYIKKSDYYHINESGKLCYDFNSILINQSSLSVIKRDTSLFCYNLRIFYNSNEHLYVKLVDNNGVAIKGVKFLFKIYLSKNKFKNYYVTTNSKGMAILKHNFNQGHYSIVINAINGNYKIKSLKSKFKIYKTPLTIKAPKIVAKYKKSKKFTIKLINKKAKKIVKNIKIKVKISIGKKYKTRTLKTNNKGLACLNTKNFKRGVHKVFISPKNTNYYGKFISKIIIK